MTTPPPRRPARVRVDVRLAPAALARVDTIAARLTAQTDPDAHPVDRSTVLRELLALGLDAWDQGRRRTLPR